MRTNAVLVLVFLSVQSMADVARREAERRLELERQGVSAKVIEGDPAQMAPSGNISTSSPSPRFAGRERDNKEENRGSARKYRTAIQKLDREIRSLEDRLGTIRERMQAERWALPKSGRSGRSSSQANSREQLQWQARDIELKLKRLRQERAALYDEGRRSGLLPGELDGKGQMP
ncbi:MAG: hypothetical protein HXY20_01290 [Acidobacteria bacterium]|nr:hypothetical protein [Acidobacteriota bacterium]